MASWIGTAAQVTVAVVFLYAALAKAADPSSFRNTVEGLGIRHPLSGPVAGAVVVVESLTAATLLTVPASWWPRVLAGVAAIGFAGVGVWAVATKRRVACRCFGNANAAVLGWRQVRLLPVWLGLVALAQWRPPDWTGHEGGVVLAFVIFGLLAWRMAGSLRLVRELRGDRIAISSLYTVSRPENLEVLP
jgi:hypothetical protein